MSVLDGDGELPESDAHAVTSDDGHESFDLIAVVRVSKEICTCKIIMQFCSVQCMYIVFHIHRFHNKINYENNYCH